MEKEKATIYDYARMCKAHKDCKFCPLSCDVNGMAISCLDMIRDYPDKANEIILKWCKGHPKKTRQSKFLEMFPNADLSFNYIDICPSAVDKHLIGKTICAGGNCSECKKEFWLAEVEENDK